jgi:tetratricopeptide (TPR) repeat protein
MKMKKIALTILTVLALLPAFAQTKTQRQDYLDRYNLLVSRLGVAGVGVETLLQRWEKDYPEDTDMLLGKFSYYLSKSQSTAIETRDAAKYLGAAPVLTLKDTLGKDVNYFQVVNYDDELFGKATQAIEKAIEMNPDRLDLRLFKISSLIGYEKDSPDMALDGLKALIDYNGTHHPKWVYPGVEAEDGDLFPSVMQEYCYAFFKIGTPHCFEAFKELSEKMLVYYPTEPAYMTNLGSYYLVYKHDNKTALKYYNKVLKKNPDDYATIKNCVLLARSEKNTKLEKKYLPMLVRVTTDEAEKASAQARLDALK